MSFQATAWAWDQKTGSASAKVVLLALAAKTDADHCACPTVDLLADETEQSRQTVRAALKRLEAEGLLEKISRMDDERGQLPNLYRLLMDDTAPRSPRAVTSRLAAGGPRLASS